MKNKKIQYFKIKYAIQIIHSTLSEICYKELYRRDLSFHRRIENMFKMKWVNKIC